MLNLKYMCFAMAIFSYNIGSNSATIHFHCNFFTDNIKSITPQVIFCFINALLLTITLFRKSQNINPHICVINISIQIQYSTIKSNRIL